MYKTGFFGGRSMTNKTEISPKSYTINLGGHCDLFRKIDASGKNLSLKCHKKQKYGYIGLFFGVEKN